MPSVRQHLYHNSGLFAIMCVLHDSLLMDLNEMNIGQCNFLISAIVITCLSTSPAVSQQAEMYPAFSTLR